MRFEMVLARLGVLIFLISATAAIAGTDHEPGAAESCTKQTHCNSVSLISGELTGELAENNATGFKPPILAHPAQRHPLAKFPTNVSLEFEGKAYDFEGFTSAAEPPHSSGIGEDCKSQVGFCCEWESIADESDRIFCEMDSFVPLPGGDFIASFHFQGGEGYFQGVAGHALAIGRQHNDGTLEASFRGLMKLASNFCAKEPGDCDGVGLCIPKPTKLVMCPTVIDRVLGCDGAIYANECAARRDGVNVLEHLDQAWNAILR